MSAVPELLALAQRIAAQARPGEQVEAFVARGRRFTVKAYRGKIEALASAGSAGVGVRVVVEGRQGFASAGTLDESVLHEVLADARDNAAFGEAQPWNGLAEPDGVPEPALHLYEPERLTPEAKVAMAIELERLVLAGDPRITGVRAAIYGDGVGEAAIATSTGIATASRSSSSSVSVSALAADGDEVQIGSGVGVGRHSGELDLAIVAADAVDRATRMLGAAPVTTRRTTVVLDRRVAASILSIVAAMLTGDAVVKGRSPFARRLGEPIASPMLTLVDDATNPASFGADSSDGEGLATRPTLLIEDGILRAFLHNTVTGRRAGTGTTASAVRGYGSTPGVGALALVPAEGAGSLDDIVAAVGDGLLVQSVSGLHSGVNPVSGDLSVGVQGLLINGGALGRPVREVTIATSLQRLLVDLVALGADLEWLPGGDAGVTMAVRDVMVSGI